jgi:DNA polymerase-3 subunit delta'
MTWHGIVGHERIVESFRRTLRRGRLASSYLFVGPGGVGKRTFARRLAQVLLCQSNPPARMDPCGSCQSCHMVLAGTHPDMDILSLPPGKKELPLELFIGDRGHRGREGFCHRLSMKPFMGGRKVGIIQDADCLNEEGSNCLLKTLEEPPAGSVLILVGTNPDRQLPTIRSRCQLIRFMPLDEKAIADLLIDSGRVTDRSEAMELASLGEGGLARACELADAGFPEFRGTFLAALDGRPMDTLRLTRAASAYIEEAGKERAARRGRAAQVVQLAVEYFRARLRGSVGTQVGWGRPLDGQPDSLGDSRPAEIEMASIDRSLDALNHIDRNANIAAAIECWMDDLARINRACPTG